MDIIYRFSIRATDQSQFSVESDWKLKFLKSTCNMLQNLFYLAVTITVVYSDCCTIFNPLCSDGDIECHIKHYGIHCCNHHVQKAMKLFADVSGKIVS